MTAAPPTTIIQTVDAKGSQYTKKDVEPLLSKARSEMAKKGLLRSDLPPAAQGLEKEATDAMKKLIQSKARVAEMVKVAKDEGMTTLVQDGVLKSFDGIMDLKQVKAVALK